ncbi:MAG: Eco57I restriction-modification methylase domain-containing protein, partial [Microthrixaceae bacterium]
YSNALHDVVGSCLYGVDINPMAADLAKVSLWLTAMTPGKPLSFLDHHIKVGNALLGTTPALLRNGVPDAAFTALTGDDKTEVTRRKRANKAERSNRGGDDLFSDSAAELDPVRARAVTTEVDQALRAAATLDEVTFAAQRYATLDEDVETQRHRLAADAWCAAFLGEKTASSVPITTAVVDDVAAGTADESVFGAVRTIAARHRLFHWHLEVPEVFRISENGPTDDTYGWSGGFDAMLGNPPWDALQFSEREFFATRDEDIANAGTAAIRKRMIARLEEGNPALFAEYRVESRRGQAEGSLIKRSDRYPLTATGKINTYALFTEHSCAVLDRSGRVGIIVPTGIVTDATTQAFARDALPRLSAVYDFRNAGFFPGVASAQGVRFCVLAVLGVPTGEPASMVFRATTVDEVHDSRRHIVLQPDELMALNPNTGTLPIFLSRRDADITLACYKRHPILIRDGGENPWNLSFKQGLFNMATDSDLFTPGDELGGLAATYTGWGWEAADDSWLPLYEAKMLHHYQHRHGTYEGYALVDGKGVRSIPSPGPHQLDEAGYETVPRYWVTEKAVRDAAPDWWDRDWILGWRDIATSLDQRTFIATALPLAAVGHKFPLAFPLDPTHAPLLQAVWSSMAFDYVSRQKLSGTGMAYFIVKQLPCPTPAAFAEPVPWGGVSLAEFVRPRVLELTYTSHRMAGYARDVVAQPASSPVGGPFRWVPERRAQLAAELDAAMLHVYGLSRPEAEHVLDSFPIVRKNEERDLAEYRTKRLVLTVYDALADAAATDIPFISPLDPPPGDGPRHPERPTPARTERSA